MNAIHGPAIVNIIDDKLKELEPTEYKNILQWMERKNWQLPIPNGTSLSLLSLQATWFEKQMADPKDEFLHTMIKAHAEHKAQEVDASFNAPASAPEDAPKPEVQPKPDNKVQTKPEQNQSRREYDNETLAQIVLEFLRENRLDEYTYNQVADGPSIWCDFKSASRILRRLEDMGSDVIEYAVKKPNGAKVKVYKYAPERKALDKDYSRTQEIIGRVIVKYLEERGAQTQNAICLAMRQYFGYLDKAVVKEVLESLRAKDQLEERVGPRNARVFSVAPKKPYVLHFDTDQAGVVGNCRELSEALIGS